MDLDLAKFFAQVNHAMLMSLVKERLTDRRVWASLLVSAPSSLTASAEPPDT